MFVARAKELGASAHYLVPAKAEYFDKVLKFLLPMVKLLPSRVCRDIPVLVVEITEITRLKGGRNSLKKGQRPKVVSVKR